MTKRGQQCLYSICQGLADLAQKKAVLMREEAQLWDIFSRDLKREAGRCEEKADRRKPLVVPAEIQNSEPQQERLLLRIAEAVKLMGISRSSLYKEINNGNLRVRKAGRRTLIAYTDIKEWFEKLP